MKRSTVIRNAVIVCSVIVMSAAVLAGFGRSASGNDRRTSRQSDYPDLPEPGLVCEQPASLSDQVQDASLIADATVLRVLEEEEREYVPEKGSTEEAIYKKAGAAKDIYTVRPIELNINETLKGHPKDKKIMMYIPPVALDSSPAFKSGDRLVFMLNPYIDGGYSSVTMQDGYYYVSEDDRIYPAKVTELLQKESGKKLKDFRSEIRKLSSKE